MRVDQSTARRLAAGGLLTAAALASRACRRQLITPAGDDVPEILDRIVLLADEWDALADRCEKRHRFACSTCVGRRVAAKQLRARLAEASR